MDKICYLAGQELFYVKSYKTTKFYMFFYFKVKRKSYMGRILLRLWEYYIKNSRSLYVEYKKYYKKEYISYTDYLVRHLNLPSELVEKIAKQLVYYKCLKNEPDSGIQNLVDITDAGLIRKFEEYMCIESLVIDYDD